MLKALPALVLALVTLTATATPTEKMNAFVSKLMAKMTLDEKIGQLVQYTADMAVTGSSVRSTYKKDIESGMVGSLFNAYTPKFTRELQHLAVDKTRLKIPLLFGYDAIHGHRTTFPIPLAESSSWDLKLMEQTSATTAREAAADGLHWTFAPMVDVTRDPRWGRVMEGAGEDPWLGSKIAAARVRGTQGSDPASTDHVLACVKHFAAYGAPIAGREYNTVDMSQRELLETYLPPYRAAVNAGVASVMTSFNEIDGVPSTGNRWLITELLRKQWGFKGMVVTDYTGVTELVPHGFAVDEKDAARLALNAGVETDMQGGLFAQHLKGLVGEKKVRVAEIDRAARHVLEAKYKLGLFTDPFRFSDDRRAEAEMMNPENIKLARESARKSIVLLKNERGVLPLKREGTIAMIGPLAQDQRNQIGNWSGAGDWRKVVSLGEGLTKVGGDKIKLLYAPGANLLENDALIDFLNVHGDGQIKKDPHPAAELIEEAVKTARRADVVVLAVGEAQNMSGEATSRTHIRIPENQQELIRAVKQTGKPLVLVVYGGRPLALEGENLVADAMVEAWWLGHQSGNAIADVLFGDYNPSGRLTMSFPRSEGQIPVFYAQKNTGRPLSIGEKFGPKAAQFKYTSRYIDSPNEPLFPFGFGLSYTKFDYSNLRLSAAKIRVGQPLTARITVKNAGSRAGEETVQLYLRDLVGSVTRPVKLLRGFEKVFLRPGESREVAFTVTTEDLKFYDRSMKWTTEPGAFKIMIGRNSSDVTEADFALQ